MSGLVQDIAAYVHTVGRDPVEGVAVLESLKEAYRYEAGEEHNITFYSEETSIEVGLPSLKQLSEAYNAVVDDQVCEDILDFLEDEYHYLGTMDKSFYVHGRETYVLDDEDEEQIRRIDRVQTEYALEELVEDYRWLRDAGEIQGAQDVWSKNRELFRAGEKGVAEVFYDQLRNQAYVFDREAITLEESDDEIIGELEIIDVQDEDRETDFDSERTVFEQLFDDLGRDEAEE